MKSVVLMCFLLCAPLWTKANSNAALVKVLRITSERVCVPQVPGDLDSGVLCGEGFRVVVESKEFYIEGVMLAGTTSIQPVPSVGAHYAGIIGGSFLSFLDGDSENAKVVTSLNIEVLRPKQESGK